MSQEEKVAARIAVLGIRHEQIEQRIKDLNTSPAPDNIVERRLKSKKLRVKRELAKLMSQQQTPA